MITYTNIVPGKLTVGSCDEDGDYRFDVAPRRDGSRYLYLSTDDAVRLIQTILATLPEARLAEIGQALERAPDIRSVPMRTPSEGELEPEIHERDWRSQETK